MTTRPRPSRLHLVSALSALVLLGGVVASAPVASADERDPSAPASQAATPGDSTTDCPSPGADASEGAGESASPQSEASPGEDATDPSACQGDGVDQSGQQARKQSRQASPEQASPRAAAPKAAPAKVVNGVTCTTANDADHTPSTANATSNTFFNLPYGTWAQRNNLRQRVFNAINAVPCGQYIQIAVYSISDKKIIDALINAYRRGVGVQVIANSHMVFGKQRSAQYLRLYRYLGQSTLKQSWARTCSRSCRGTGGNHHFKMYLFGQVHHSHHVSMMGSHNSTTKAVYGQWNHMDVTAALDTYRTYQGVFKQLSADKAQRSPSRDYRTTGVETYFFPRPGTNASNDPMMADTAGIRCTGAKAGYGRNGRSVVRIGMYAWFDSRGVYLAKRVRALWNAGCDVAVEYAILGNTVKKILYNPSGRGRIPMRQVTTSGKGGKINNYLHDKYIAFSGRQWSYTNVDWVATGTTNWSNLGLASDDFTQVWRSRGRTHNYLANFYGVWRGPKAHVPSPTSRLPGKVGTGKVQFGKGKYANLETN